MQDLFEKGSVWRGKEVQLNGKAIDVELKVLERTGTYFRADMSWGGKHGRYIEGSIKDGVLAWGGAKGETNPGVPHSATLTGRVLAGDLVAPRNGQQVRLTFRYERVSIKE